MVLQEIEIMDVASQQTLGGSGRNTTIASFGFPNQMFKTDLIAIVLVAG